MNTHYILAAILFGASATAVAGMAELKGAVVKKLGRTPVRFFSTHNKKSGPVIPHFISNIRIAASFDPEIAKIRYAPNYPLRQVSRQDVFCVTPDGVAKKTHSLVRLVDTKWGYDRTFHAVTLREGDCTESNCTQQIVGRISDISTLKVLAKNPDTEVKEQEVMYGKLQPQKFESVDVDVAKEAAGVLSACPKCQKIELIFPKPSSSDKIAAE